jgi:hypothetical protein
MDRIDEFFSVKARPVLDAQDKVSFGRYDGGNGVAMPGMADSPFELETPERGLMLDESALPDGVGIGADSLIVGIDKSAFSVPDSYFDSDGSRYFHDSPRYDASGFDAMAGLAGQTQPSNSVPRNPDIADGQSIGRMYSPESDDSDEDDFSHYPTGAELKPGVPMPDEMME